MRVVGKVAGEHVRVANLAWWAFRGWQFKKKKRKEERKEFGSEILVSATYQVV